MKWKKIKYPYTYCKEKPDLMEQSIKNFEKFKKYTGVDKYDVFNYGYDISAVFRGENPRYNQYSIDYFGSIDHLHYLYRNSKTNDTYAIAVPYREDTSSNSEHQLKRLCNKHNVSCIVLPPKDSIYNAYDTNFIIFSHRDKLVNLLKKYGYKKEEIQIIDPDISFYRYVMKYIKVDLPEGDFAKDMKDDKEMPKQKDNDMEVFSYLDFTVKDINAERIYERLKNDYLEGKKEMR